jgi:hypothetical protein
MVISAFYRGMEKQATDASPHPRWVGVPHLPGLMTCIDQDESPVEDHGGFETVVMAKLKPIPFD